MGAVLKLSGILAALLNGWKKSDGSRKTSLSFQFFGFCIFSSWWTKLLTQRWTIRLKSSLRRSVLRCCNFGISMIIWSLNNLFIFRKFHFSPNITSFVSFCYFLAKFPIDYCLNYWQSIHSWKENARTKILKKVISFSKKSNWGLKVQSSNNLVAKVNKPERSTFETVKLFIAQKSPKKLLRNQFPFITHFYTNLNIHKLLFISICNWNWFHFHEKIKFLCWAFIVVKKMTRNRVTTTAAD